jgi:hypothetical protein
VYAARRMLRPASVLLVAALAASACERADSIPRRPDDAGPGPRRVELPEATCRITASTTPAGVPLRTTPGGAPYGEAGSRFALMGSLLAGREPAEPRPEPVYETEVAIPEGPVDVLAVTYRTDRVVVKGFAAVSDVELHPAKAVVTGGFLIATRVRPTAARAAVVEVEPVPTDGVELVGARSWALACGELSLGYPDAPRELAPPALPRPRPAVLTAGQVVALAVEPGGEPVAHLFATASSPSVEVLEERGPATRILWRLDGALVFGWVDSAALSSVVRGMVKTSSGRAVPVRPAPLAAVRCARTVDLLVDDGGAPTIVGQLLPQATINVEERVGTRSRIQPPAPSRRGMVDVEPAKGTSFWVASADIAGCPAAPPEPAPEPDLVLGTFKGLEGIRKATPSRGVDNK